MAVTNSKSAKKRPLSWWAVNAALSFFGVFLFTIITCTIAGAYYPATLEAMHLDWFAIPLRGIYTDCSDPGNRHAVYCQPKTSGYNMKSARIKEAGRPSPFTLYDRPGSK